MGKITKKYSGTFIIIPEKSESVTEVTGSINSIINENGGKILKENLIGKKTLASPIKKKKEGVYYQVIFDAETGSVSNMMRQFLINTNLLRSLIDRT
ncbi:MAG: 30S ribosomal protein S6 [Candidatus Omnitrophica bacterium]|nr:30S ribosomal protein S6 [Candidatus Omnitrophota bacterium]